MGIRYFAHPVSPRQLAQSRECPRGCFDGADAWDHWSPGDEPMLRLDRCYPEVRRWLCSGGGEARPAAALFGGGVGFGIGIGIGIGGPRRRTLDNAQAREIADDLDALLAAGARSGRGGGDGAWPRDGAEPGAGVKSWEGGESREGTGPLLALGLPRRFRIGAGHRRRSARGSGGQDCLGEHLDHARDFARRVTDAGFGIHYRLG